MKTLIISPSGKFYGSEQTLFNFLSQTEGYDVYIKHERNGLHDRLLTSNFNHNYFLFKSTSRLYFVLFFILFYKYSSVYCNEGGHSRYITLFAKIFFWKAFYIHVRLTEDTVPHRWGKIPKNLHLISTSSYIQKLLISSINTDSILLSSPARAFKQELFWDKTYNEKAIKSVGIVGRVTTSKGVLKAIELFDYLERENISSYDFTFYGDVEESDSNVERLIDCVNRYQYVKVNFMGYIDRASSIYSGIDLVIHFNTDEPLGVVFLESLNQGKPFIGFNSGGIGCIAERLSIEHLMIRHHEGWCSDILLKMDGIDIKAYAQAREVMNEIYSPQEYCSNLSKLIK